jgi:hypothetical protein
MAGNAGNEEDDLAAKARTLRYCVMKSEVEVSGVAL